MLQKNSSHLSKLSKMSSTEPLLNEDDRRFCLFPIQHSDIWDYYKKLLSTMWLAEDISLDQDVIDYRKSSQTMRGII